MEFINLHGQGIKADLDKRGLKKLIILPDYCPGRGRLPVGSVAVYDKEQHIPSAEFLGPDIGCGMTLAKFDKPIGDLEYLTYTLGEELQGVDSELSSLGGGNHFIDFYQVISADGLGLSSGEVVALVHSGSRLRGERVFKSRLQGDIYLDQYEDAVNFGVQNRNALLDAIKSCAKCDAMPLLDLPHNTLEVDDSEITYRKGAVRLNTGQYSVLPSCIGGKAILIRANDSISELEDSMCHGTGRKISRSQAKKIPFDSKTLRDRVFIPSFICDDSIKTEAPCCYREIEEILPKIEKYVSVVGELKALAYLS